jgi:hypothetical protein
MAFLVDVGVLQRVYRVETPDGLLLDNDYPSRAAIPQIVADRSEKRYFDTAEGEIVSGFRLETAGVER